MSFSNTNDFFDNEIFEKRCGQRRWLNKEHNKEKTRLHEMTKDCSFLEKTMESPEEMSKNARSRLVKTLNNDFSLDVSYSLNKKNRWVIEKSLDVLDPEAEGFSTKLVERNILNRKRLKKRVKTSKTSEEPGPEVIFKIYKAHPSKDLSIRPYIVSKSHARKKQGNKKREKSLVIEEYYYSGCEDYTGFYSEYSDDDDFFPKPRVDKKINFNDVLEDGRASLTEVPKKPSRTESSVLKTKNQHHEKEKFENNTILDVQKYLVLNEHTFFDVNVKFGKIYELNFQDEIGMIKEKSIGIVKFLKKTQVLLDLSKWSNQNGAVPGETSFVIVITQICQNKINFLINSTSHTSAPTEDIIKNLRVLVSGARSLSYAVEKICENFAINREIINALKDHSNNSFSPSTFSTFDNFDPQNPLSNFLNFGIRQDWNNISSLALEAHIHYNEPATSSDLGFSICKTHELSQNLYKLADGSEKCRDCLRKVFYKEFESGKISINLEIIDSTSLQLRQNTFDILPAIIPLPIYNLYIRKLYSKRSDQFFDYCKNCKSTLIFSNISNSTRSCPCGFSWCNKCEQASHYPMTCDQFALWDQKWKPRYDLTVAQGLGNEYLMRIVCQCKYSVFNVRMPSPTAECPKCKKNFSLETLEVIPKWKKDDYYRCHKGFLYFYYSQMWIRYKDVIKKFKPFEMNKRHIDTIPKIKKSVVEICTKARSLRIDETCKSGETILNSTLLILLCLIENVTAWMYISNNFDRTIERKLEQLIVKKEKLVEVIGTKDEEIIQDQIKIIQENIQLIIDRVEQKKTERKIFSLDFFSE